LGIAAIVVIAALVVGISMLSDQGFFGDNAVSSTDHGQKITQDIDLLLIGQDGEGLVPAPSASQDKLLDYGGVGLALGLESAKAASENEQTDSESENAHQQMIQALPDEGEGAPVIYVEAISRGAQTDQTDKPLAGKNILIYHTHTYEAYLKTDTDVYAEDVGSQGRTTNTAYSIVAVGDHLAELLTDLGAQVVHDTTEFEPPRLGTAYVRSVKMLEKRKSDGEDYDLCINLHRDASSGRTDSDYVTIGGVNYAKLMMLIGTGEGDGKNQFQQKPEWKSNYLFALELTDTINEMYPGLCRSLLAKTGRYNQHVFEQMILVEDGHNYNYLSEALASTEPLAKAIVKMLS
jgi:stage II sporulation protein P